jgi:CTP:molybdopterin cytidylyltransferase MocA
VLGDQPDISAGVIDALIAAYQEGRKGIVVPVFKGRRGHPLLVDLKYREEIVALPPETGLRGLLTAHSDDILEVGLREEGILTDIDTPEEYRHALRQAGRRDSRGGGDTVLRPPTPGDLPPES